LDESEVFTYVWYPSLITSVFSVACLSIVREIMCQIFIIL